MAISSGIRALRAYVSINGTRYAVQSMDVTVEATRRSGTFRASLPLAGMAPTVADLGDNETLLIVSLNGAETTLMVGQIDEADLDFIGGTLDLSGRDVTAKLQSTASAEKWVNKKNSEIVSDIAGRIGLTADVPSDTQTAGNYVQIDWSLLTDGARLIDVLQRICDAEGFRWWLTGKTIVVRRDGDQTDYYPVNYAETPGKVSDALSLKVIRNLEAGKTIEAKATSWNPRKKQAYGAAATLAGSVGTAVYGFDVPGASQPQMTEKAKAKAREKARHEYLVRAELVGDPTITPAQKMRLTGTGAMDQDFLIDRITHRIGRGGYTMEIEARGPKATRDPSLGLGGAKTSTSTITTKVIGPQ